MKFIRVKELPEQRFNNNNSDIARYLEGFANSDAKVVRVEYTPTDYRGPISAYSSIAKAIKRSGYGMTVHCIGEHIYIKKTY